MERASELVEARGVVRCVLDKAQVALQTVARNMDDKGNPRAQHVEGCRENFHDLSENVYLS